MLPKLIEDAQHHLSVAQAPSSTQASFALFIDACMENKAVLALQSAPTDDAGGLTFGLNRAVKAGHLDLARRLVEIGAKYDSFSVHTLSTSLDGVKWLLDTGYHVNTGLMGGGTLLCITVENNDEASIRHLLGRGANPNLGPPLNGQGPIAQIRPVINAYWILNSAASVCSPEIFALLLSHGADISKATPLHYAAGHAPSPHNVPYRSGIPMLEYLLGLGLDINAEDGVGDAVIRGGGRQGSPLHYAVVWGRVEEARWLLEKGADPDRKSRFGVSARDQIARSGSGCGPAMRKLFERYTAEVRGTEVPMQ